MCSVTSTQPYLKLPSDSVLFKCIKPGQRAIVFINALQENRTGSVCMYV